ncbi:MAG TPA: hypothetical protein PLI96_11205 [Halothiobacillus sp.]|nr:hypothetical protein [Halothiobacillus sp.]
MDKNNLTSPIGYHYDPIPGGLYATVLRFLKNSSAMGIALIESDGSATYVSRAEAERLLNQSKKQVQQ